MHVTHCRACEGGPLRPFLDLGRTALANRFLRPDQLGAPEPLYPLRLAFCGQCGLVQIDEQVPPEVLFKDYVYVSGTSDLIHAHADRLAGRLARWLGLKPGDLVLEAASNDGTVLKAFRKYGVKVVGVEPAANIAERANRAGVETVCEFFGDACAGRVRDRCGPARLVLARHVLAHVADLHGFVKGLGRALAPDGLAAVEVPHLLPFCTNLEYDTVYHEHLCYFSVHVLWTLFDRFGLEVVDVEEAAIHGGSVVVAAQRRGGPHAARPSVRRLLEAEERAGLHRFESWQGFAGRVAASKEALLAELDGLRAAGRTLAGYGAPAKGMTLLSYCGIGPDRLPYLVDKSPYKQGLVTPGHHVPIFPPEKLLQDRPDVVLVLAWNFAPEIARQQAEYLRRGGRFLLPIPAAHYWDGPAHPSSPLAA